jgi:hypothetical protein
MTPIMLMAALCSGLTATHAVPDGASALASSSASSGSASDDSAGSSGGSASGVSYTEQVGSLIPGSDIHIANYTDLSLAKAYCSAHKLCRAYTFKTPTVAPPPPPQPPRNTHGCYLRSHVNVSNCYNNTANYIYTLARGIDARAARSTLTTGAGRWTKLQFNYTCGPGKGAEVPPDRYGTNPIDWPYGPFGQYDMRSGCWSPNTTVALCKAACVANPNCTAIGILPSPGPPPPPPLAAGGDSLTATKVTTVYFKLGYVEITKSNIGWTTIAKVPAVTHLEVETPLGTLRGSRATAGDGAGSFDQFLGVRYSQPMNATTRWRRADQRLPWSGVLDALEYGSSCPSQNQPPGNHLPTICLRPMMRSICVLSGLTGMCCGCLFCVVLWPTVRRAVAVLRAAWLRRRLSVPQYLEPERQRNRATARYAVDSRRKFYCRERGADAIQRQQHCADRPQHGLHFDQLVSRHTPSNSTIIVCLTVDLTPLIRGGLISGVCVCLCCCYRAAGLESLATWARRSSADVLWMA